jgi:hypothetical protein
MSVAERDAYAVLGVARGADDETIAAAFRALARRFHPDVAGDTATRQMMDINAAFDDIRTIERRTEYDDSGPRATSPADQPTTRPSPEVVDRDRWRWRPERDGTGGAGPPPGRPSGSVLDFGRHIGWSLGEIERVDPGYLLWLSDRPEGLRYLDEIEVILQRVGYRSDPAASAERRGPWRGVVQRR